MVAFRFPGGDGHSATKSAKWKKTFIRLQTPGKRKDEDFEGQASSTPHDSPVYSSKINCAAGFASYNHNGNAPNMKLLSHDKPMEGPGDLGDSIQIYAGVFHITLDCNPSLMAFSGQFLASMHRGSAQFSSRSKEPIRSGLDISSDILVINTALRRERAHEVDLEKSRRYRAKQRAVDPTGYVKRVNADKAAWGQKNPQKVLGIAARVRSKAKDPKRFFYEDCNTNLPLPLI
ncbi:uncharacterized protein FTJAE_87 [Fusarium tjaetaba]|uniref:Uncharacterized protein n=1 Tax=Fusarium tjaetaba TaxID=1567544 RepID=A0A8H5SIX7_9HYPO|nr:uncharacterized protein FTJAE_87 [Fusarium tjaetaba]KAF5651607.1 hypothetical protein FTJAE_87 [Fusarium tjaetaba]